MTGWERESILASYYGVLRITKFMLSLLASVIMRNLIWELLCYAWTNLSIFIFNVVAMYWLILDAYCRNIEKVAVVVDETAPFVFIGINNWS